MTTHEIELKALMLASLDGDAASHRELLDRLSRRLRAYFKGKLARFGRGAAEAVDLVQEAVLAIHFKRHTYDPAEPLTPWVHAIAMRSWRMTTTSTRRVHSTSRGYGAAAGQPATNANDGGCHYQGGPKSQMTHTGGR